jgi:hypothetical protein
MRAIAMILLVALLACGQEREEPRVISARDVPPRADLNRLQRVLGGGRLRIEDDLVVIDAPGRGPDYQDSRRNLVEHVQRQVTAQSGDPRLGVSLRFAGSGRVVTSWWSEASGRFEVTDGVAGGVKLQ